MSINRVQKLLLSEYCDFEDLVLIESPFAQTTKEGKGLRQVHLGLTPSKLILATDILPRLGPTYNACTYNPFIDPEIETFELIAIYPVECVNLSIYRRKRRQAIKARFCNNKVLYFELGGFERRGMFWNLWCEKVKFLCPSGNSGSSRSETSVATSTTGSSLYVIDKKVVSLNGIKQLWCKFGPNFINEAVTSNSQSLVKKWTDRYLYLGRDLADSPLDYKPIVKHPYLKEFIRPKVKSRLKLEYPSVVDQQHLAFGDSVLVNRFGSGILEGCGTGLYLTCDDYVAPKRYSSTVLRATSSDLSLEWRSVDYDEIAETAVLLWEYYGISNLRNNRKVRHRRRYGFAPKPLFLYGLGPWQVAKGDRFSLQLKRASSDVNLLTTTGKNTLKLPVSKRQLFATISCPVLHEGCKHRTNNIINAPKKPVIFFWTPGYWYRPISARDAYSELQRHLKKIKEFHETTCSKGKRRRCTSRKFLRRFSTNKDKETDEDEENDNITIEKKKRKHNFIATMLGTKIDDGTTEWKQNNNETPLQHLKKMLKFDASTTAWDFDSTTLAQQLTMIDRDLFLKVTATELNVLLWQQNAKNAPNIAAMIAFSARISCLIASEILRDDSEKMRARLMARFINVANKCHRISNFNSCRSVLCGLQNPAIFRLRRTWAYVRKKHASKYQMFEFLCRLYRDPRMPSFQKTFFIFSQHPPFLPYIGHIIAKLFDKVPEYKIQTNNKRAVSRQISFCTTKSFKSISSDGKSAVVVPTAKQQNGIFSKLFSVFSNGAADEGAGDCIKPKKVKRKKAFAEAPHKVKLKGLYEYFKPLDDYEDRRPETLLAVVELLEKGQLAAISYGFSCNELVRDFLLKARHYDDQDNFFNSLRVEGNTSRNTQE